MAKHTYTYSVIASHPGAGEWDSVKEAVEKRKPFPDSMDVRFLRDGVTVSIKPGMEAEDLLQTWAERYKREKIELAAREKDLEQQGVMKREQKYKPTTYHPGRC